ncbi:MAG: hypothetical protein SV422_09650, partial [Pseudomonadota bacterium]|nr:hypothetical protein [Pseudomonadota bacterium]
MTTTINRPTRTRIALALAGAAAIALASPTIHAQAPGRESAVIHVTCDYACLTGLARTYMENLAKRDPSPVPFADDAVFSENNVTMPIGNDGLWGTASA